MASKKIGKAVGRRLFILGIPALLVVGYFIMTAFTYTYNIIDLDHQKKELEKQLNLLKAGEQDLKIELQKLNNPEYIARYARENYLYSKDGEYIIKIDRTKTINNNNDFIEEDNYQYIYLGLGILTTLFIIRFIKKKRNHKKKT